MQQPPRVLIFGAGAIGSCMGALLAEAGADVTLLARGSHADAMEARGGVSLREPGGRDREIAVRVCRPDALDGRYDLVFVTLKSSQLAQAAEAIMDAVAADGAVVMVQNGLPWWFFTGLAHPLGGQTLRSLDPDGKLAATMDLRRIVGGVIYRTAAILEPGVVSVPKVAKQRLVIGELDGQPSQRCEAISQLLGKAGLPVEVTLDIRRAKWEKLLVNLLWNPLAAVTQSTPAQVVAFPAAHDTIASIVSEGAAVAAATGFAMEADPQAQMRRSESNFMAPSMLQDIRAGKALELDAILGAIVEIADLCGIAVPTLKAIGTCAALLDARIQADRVAIGPQPGR
jgi:2-dehydropantoate 2-reductase